MNIALFICVALMRLTAHFLSLAVCRLRVEHRVEWLVRTLPLYRASPPSHFNRFVRQAIASPPVIRRIPIPTPAPTGERQ